MSDADVRNERLARALDELAAALTHYVTGDWSVAEIAGELEDRLTLAEISARAADDPDARWTNMPREQARARMLALAAALVEDAAI